MAIHLPVRLGTLVLVFGATGLATSLHPRKPEELIVLGPTFFGFALALAVVDKLWKALLAASVSYPILVAAMQCTQKSADTRKF